MEPTTTTNPQKEAHMAAFPLATGTALPEGVIVSTTLTAYEVETPEGATVFVPFTRVHPLTPATPLVIFG